MQGKQIVFQEISSEEARSVAESWFVMVRLIDAYSLWTDIQMLPHNGDIISSDDVEQAIICAPTIDPDSMREMGEWIEYKGKSAAFPGKYYCSKCFKSSCKRTPYCPECGIKMKR